jgi:hypothetical protein
MGQVSMRRAREINEYVLEHGEPETVEKYGLSLESLHRYLRIVNNQKSFRHPKVLLLDCETLPLWTKTWSLYPKYIDYKQIIKDSCLLSWSAKWLYASDIMGDIMTPKEAKSRDDKRILESIWKLIDDSDILIAHNGIRFDFPFLNTRFIVNKIKPPSPYQVVDTLKVCKRDFRNTSNRLDYIGQLLVNDRKKETNIGLWDACDNGEQDGLDKMLEYNKQDVVLLEEVYLELLPWIKSHPNMAIYLEAIDECCPNCGSFDLEEKGVYTTPAGQYEGLICKSCGKPSRRKVNILTKEQREHLLVSNAR